MHKVNVSNYFRRKVDKQQDTFLSDKELIDWMFLVSHLFRDQRYNERQDCEHKSTEAQACCTAPWDESIKKENTLLLHCNSRWMNTAVMKAPEHELRRSIVNQSPVAR